MATTLVGATEDQQPTQTPPADSPPQSDDSSVGKTAEEVDTQWRHRVSQKDKAHAAAEAALREENDRLKSQLATASRPPSAGQTGDGGGSDAYLREQLAQKDREIEQERSLRAIEAKRAKFPALARQVGESGSGIFSTADDATLAKLNALADDEDSSTFAPMTPRRAAPAPPKSLTEMTKAELEAELKRSVERGGHNR